MIDYFALILIHGLLVIAFFRLVTSEKLDREDPGEAQSADSAGDGDRA